MVGLTFQQRVQAMNNRLTNSAGDSQMDIRAAADRIVEASRRNRQVEKRDLAIWLRDGAVFGQPDHALVGNAWSLASAISFLDISDEDLDDGLSAIVKLREGWAEFAPFYITYGSLPVTDSELRQCYLITACEPLSSDRPLCIVRDVDVFRRATRLSGTLWQHDFREDDPMTATDATLHSLLNRARKFAVLYV